MRFFSPQRKTELLVIEWSETKAISVSEGSKLTLDCLDSVTTAPVNAPQLAQRQNSHAARGGLFLPATETEQFRVESSQTKATSVSAGSKSTLDSLDLVTTAPVIVPHDSPANRDPPTCTGFGNGPCICTECA